MCSKNQKVGYLIRAIHNKSLFDSESFLHFAKSPFLIKLLLLCQSHLKNAIRIPRIVLISKKIFI